MKRSTVGIALGVMILSGCASLGIFDQGPPRLENYNPRVAHLGYFRFDRYPLSPEKRYAAFQEDLVSELNTWIFGQLLVRHDPPEQDFETTLTHRYLRRNGTVYGEYTRTYTTQAGWTGTYMRFGYGQAVTGSWPAGRYTHQVFLESGEKLAEGSFRVVSFGEAPFRPQLVGIGTPGGWPQDDLTNYGFAGSSQYMTRHSENQWSYSWYSQGEDLEFKIRRPGDWQFAYTNDEDSVRLNQIFPAYVGQTRGDTEVSVPGPGMVTVTLWFSGKEERGRPEMLVEFEPGLQPAASTCDPDSASAQASIEEPADLDTLWNRYFETGDLCAVTAILNVLDWQDKFRAEINDFIASAPPSYRDRALEILDQLNISVNERQTRITSLYNVGAISFIMLPDDTYGPLIRELSGIVDSSEATLAQMMITGSAVWSLRSNAEQHADVRQHLLDLRPQVSDSTRYMIERYIVRSDVSLLL